MPYKALLERFGARQTLEKQFLKHTAKNFDISAAEHRLKSLGI